MDAWINTYLPGGHISVLFVPLDLTRMAMLYDTCFVFVDDHMTIMDYT